MDENLSPRPERRHPMELQLTAMIDVFSMIVIFLILGTVFGASEMVLPPGLKLPFSFSKEGVETAPRITIYNGKISGNFFPETFDISIFRSPEGSEEKQALETTLKIRIKDSLKSKEPLLLNTIADQNTSYPDVFDVIRIFRKAGFKSVLFLASGEGTRP